MNPRAGKGLHPLVRILGELQDEKQIMIQDVAYALKVSPSTVWAWRAGRRQPNMWQVAAYGKLVGADLMWRTNGRNIKCPESDAD